MKPEYPLPWSIPSELSVPSIVSANGKNIFPNGISGAFLKDVEYVVHACNAYPKLVEALKLADLERRYRLGPNAIAFKKLLEEFGEEAE